MTKVNAIVNTPTTKKHSTLKHTAIAAGMGATLGGAVGYVGQKLYIQEGVSLLAEVFNMPVFRKMSKQFVDSAREIIQKIIDTKLISKKMLLQTGLAGAALFSGIYLLAKGVKTLFVKNKKD